MDETELEEGEIREEPVSKISSVAGIDWHSVR